MCHVPTVMEWYKDHLRACIRNSSILASYLEYHRFDVSVQYLGIDRKMRAPLDT